MITGPPLPSVEVDGLRVAYSRTGRGPQLILLHGILSDSRAWQPQIDRLSEDFTVVAWDAPGAGQSSDPPESIGAGGYADCLANFIGALKLGSAHVLGLSWGGVLAQELYRRHPGLVSSLILADTYAGWRGSLPDSVCDERLAGCLRESEMPADEFVPAWLPGLLSPNASPEMVDGVVRIMSEFHPAGYRAMALGLAETDTRALLPRITVPTLLLWGDADKRSSLDVARSMHEAIPTAKLVVIPDAGHGSNVEQPARFNTEVRAFCSAVESERPVAPGPS